MQEARGFKAQAFASSTKASYKTHLMTYLRFCLFYSLVPVPASHTTIACFMAHLARTMSPASVNIYMNIVRILHEEAGLNNPLCDNYQVSQMKRGLLRQKGLPPVQKAPMTPEILALLYDTLNFSTNMDKAFWCAVLVGFFGFLRKASLFPNSPTVPPLKRLCRQDVSQLSLASFDLTCNHSKTNQFNQRTHVIPYSSCRDRRLCPVFAMLSHLGASDLGPLTPLFNYVEKGAERFHTHTAFVTRLKRGLAQCGIDPKHISCHSLRRGGATLSFAAGVPADQIKVRGDWASDAYQRYIVLDLESKRGVSRTLCESAAQKSLAPL
jgi:integrase